MKVYVCVKHVPDTAANIKLVGDAGFDESIKFIMNPFDEYAVEEAIRLVEKNSGEVVVVSVGKTDAVKTIRKALAVGGDRGILVKTDIPFLDSTTTALALKAAIVNDGTPDLILTGKQSVDTEGMQTHYRLAAAFGMPVANDVVSFKLEKGKAVVECELDGGDRELVELSLPCVVGATKGLNEPRLANLMGIAKAGKKPLKQIDLPDLGIELSTRSFEVKRLASLPERGQARMLEGSAHEMVEELIQRLKNEAKVL